MSKKYRLFYKWLLVFIWMVLIFYLSSQNGETSGNLSFTVLGYLINLNLLPASVVPILSFLIRKAAHMCEYAVLAFLFFNVLKEYNCKDKNKFLFSFLFAIVYACSDEFHQTFVNGRAGQITDVLIDSLGAFFGLLLYVWFYKWHSKK